MEIMKNHHALNEPIFTIVINLSHRFFFCSFVHLFIYLILSCAIYFNFIFSMIFFLKKILYWNIFMVKSLIVKFSTKAKKEIAIENHMDFVKLESFDQCSQILIKELRFSALRSKCKHQNQT